MIFPSSDPDFTFWLISVFVLYAETHYAFKWIYSRLKKAEPEIIADLPLRLEPGQLLPVLILVKDAHRFPVTLNSINVSIASSSNRAAKAFTFERLKITQPLWSRVLQIDLPKEFTGSCCVNVELQVSVGTAEVTVQNDNYACTDKRPFKIYISPTPLPGSASWHFGEFHCHTSYTSDQVEFGAPLQETAILAMAMGLSYFCATDHSYDLDDDPGNYLEKDPKLTKWREFRKEVHEHQNGNADFVIIPGEEVSAGNSKGQNIHFIILNHPQFIPGDGDSAERWLRTKPSLSIKEILQQLNSQTAAFAAHPTVKPPLLQRLFVRRGQWSAEDCSHEKLTGMQIWNGTDEGLDSGLGFWTDLLLQGRKVYISGGNDAHGNFNRFRQIGLPFLTMRENDDHLFGKVRTGVLLDGKVSVGSIIDAFCRGRMIVTDGPFVEIMAGNETGKQVAIGSEIRGGSFTLSVKCSSTEEFGRLEELRLWQGSIGEKKERLWRVINDFKQAPDFHTKLDPEPASSRYYIRAELTSRSQDGTYRCLTNPIWFSPIK